MTITIDPVRLAQITTLGKGAHAPQRIESGACLLEAAAWLAGEPWSDHPVCVCPTLASPGRIINDAMDDITRQRLVALVPLLVGTRGSTALMLRRAFVAADYAVRVFVPLALEAAGLLVEAQTLRALPVIASRAAADRARAAADRAGAAAARAGAAAARAGAAADSAEAAAYSAEAAAYSARATADSAWAAADSARAAANSAEAAANSAGAAVWDEAIACLSAMIALTD